MSNLSNYPLVVCLIAFGLLWASTKVGLLIRSRHPIDADARDNFGVVLTGTLTLLGLIIGFSFSMAVGRYDQRKNLEEAEANAIGTEYVRVDFLHADEAAKTRGLLKQYLARRIDFYSTNDDLTLTALDARTADLQTALWTVVADAGNTRPTPVMALVVDGMNDVLNSQGYTQAARWNRIPTAVWLLMIGIAICATALAGLSARHMKSQRILSVMLPFVVSLSFLLIADIDSPAGGIIRVAPQNLHALADSLRTS